MNPLRYDETVLNAHSDLIYYTLAIVSWSVYGTPTYYYGTTWTTLFIVAQSSYVCTTQYSQNSLYKVLHYAENLSSETKSKLNKKAYTREQILLIFSVFSDNLAGMLCMASKHTLITQQASFFVCLRRSKNLRVFRAVAV